MGSVSPLCPGLSDRRGWRLGLSVTSIRNDLVARVNGMSDFKHLPLQCPLGGVSFILAKGFS